MGRWKAEPQKPASELNDDELTRLGLKKGTRCRLEFVSGFVIEGELIDWVRSQGKLVLIQWKNCRVTRGSEVFYQPEWGVFDQIVGEKPVSVYAGPADRELYGEYELGKVSTSPGRASPYSALENKVSIFYDGLRKMRDEAKASVTELKRMSGQIMSQTPEEWLLNVEILELLNSSLHQAEGSRALAEHLQERLLGQAKQSSPDIAKLIHEGLRLAALQKSL